MNKLLLVAFDNEYHGVDEILKVYDLDNLEEALADYEERHELAIKNDFYDVAIIEAEEIIYDEDDICYENLARVIKGANNYIVM